MWIRVVFYQEALCKDTQCPPCRYHRYRRGRRAWSFGAIRGGPGIVPKVFIIRFGYIGEPGNWQLAICGVVETRERLVSADSECLVFFKSSPDHRTMDLSPTNLQYIPAGPFSSTAVRKAVRMLEFTGWRCLVIRERVPDMHG